ncbi:MAG: hypothetical protein KY464_16195 [Gemmatimonadetes bacterium]|nr:hypothetical protein [Gemmatimonadota bacterium]
MEGGSLGIVRDVHPGAVLPRLARDERVDVPPVRRRDHQLAPARVPGRVRPRGPGEAEALHRHREGRGEIRRHDLGPSARLDQRVYLARRHGTAAHDEYPRAAQIEQHRVERAHRNAPPFDDCTRTTR